MLIILAILSQAAPVVSESLWMVFIERFGFPGTVCVIFGVFLYYLFKDYKEQNKEHNSQVAQNLRETQALVEQMIIAKGESTERIRELIHELEHRPCLLEKGKKE